VQGTDFERYLGTKFLALFALVPFLIKSYSSIKHLLCEDANLHCKYYLFNFGVPVSKANFRTANFKDWYMQVPGC